MSIHNTCILGLSQTNYPVLHPIPLHDSLIHAGHSTIRLTQCVYIHVRCAWQVHACPLVVIFMVEISAADSLFVTTPVYSIESTDGHQQVLVCVPYGVIYEIALSLRQHSMCKHCYRLMSII